MKKEILFDNGGRRSGGDRRAFSYAIHIPELRSGIDRRSGVDKRKKPRYKKQIVKERLNQEIFMD